MIDYFQSDFLKTTDWAKSMGDQMDSKIKILLEKGVGIPQPHGVEIGDEVDPDRISGDGVTIHNGVKIFGRATLICRGATLGYEAPVTVDNCQVGPHVSLKGGYFKAAVFLEKAAMGSGAQVREGTILEEAASGAHTVGLKQTILFPYVTLGSLINFCDCLMSGGTGPKDHSEVGSSYIHFNFTPNQDKATPSLLGEVPRGVFLNQPPIFLGGQGGLVGPCRLAFGTVIAAGSIYRKDELRPGRLLVEGGGRRGNIPHIAGFYRSITRIVQNNTIYLANLIALRTWYDSVRRQFVSEMFPEALLEGLLEKVDMAIAERSKRLAAFSDKMAHSARIYTEMTGDKASASLLAQKKELPERWPAIAEMINPLADELGCAPENDLFSEIIHKHIQAQGRDYLRVIKNLSTTETAQGAQWLQGIADRVTQRVFELLPAFTFKK